MRQSLWRVFTDFSEWRIFMALLNKKPRPSRGNSESGRKIGTPTATVNPDSGEICANHDAWEARIGRFSPARPARGALRIDRLARLGQGAVLRPPGSPAPSAS